MNCLERSCATLVISSALCTPALGSDPAGISDPLEREVFELMEGILDEAKGREEANENRKVTCDELSTQRIEATRAWIRTNWEEIYMDFSATCNATPECEIFDKEVFFEKLGKPQGYCPTDNLEASGVVIEMPSPVYPEGAYGVYPEAFSDPCELVSTVIHEEAHVIFETLHNYLWLGKDNFHILDTKAGDLCRQEAWHYE